MSDVDTASVVSHGSHVAPRPRKRAARGPVPIAIPDMRLEQAFLSGISPYIQPSILGEQKQLSLSDGPSFWLQPLRVDW